MTVVERVRAEGLLAPGSPVVVMLSGGRDSTCLLDLAVRICGSGAVTALHVNYGLRAGAGEDERRCRELCARLGVPVEVRRLHPPERGNLQAWAREARYGAAEKLAGRCGADVAAGHTLSDQVETILYRLASSPSRRALYGMPAREGRLVRPLLPFTRDDTAAYCSERGLAWSEDESNDSPAYARNRVRSGLVPALRAVHPGAEANVLALAAILRDEGAALDALVDDILQGNREVGLAQLRALPAAVRRLVVQRLADDAAGGLAPRAGRRAEEVAALSDRGTAELQIGDGLRAVAEYGVLRVERLGDSPVPPAVTLTVPGRVGFGDYEVVCQLAPAEPGPGVVDRAALGPELLVRSWRPGDRMAPLGLDGTKTLQDLFTARRIPRRQRAGVPVVESAGEIVWVAGVATSERFKVTAKTDQTACLMVRKPRHGTSASEAP